MFRVWRSGGGGGSKASSAAPKEGYLLGNEPRQDVVHRCKSIRSPLRKQRQGKFSMAPPQERTAAVRHPKVDDVIGAGIHGRQGIQHCLAQLDGLVLLPN